MRILDRYLGRVVATHVGVVMGVLISMYLFSQVVAEMEYVGRGDYTTADALLYSLMLIPRQLYELFPMAALLGSMLGLGAMANHSELTVIRAAGVSVGRVLLSVLKVGLLLVLVAVFFGEGVASLLEKQAHIQRARLLAENISVNAKDGVWAREGDTFYHIRRLLPEGKADGITLYRFDEENRLVELSFAPRAEYIPDKGWLLYKQRGSEVSDQRVKSHFQKEVGWQTKLEPEVIEVVAIPPENLGIVDLYAYVSYLRENELDAGQYELSFWTRAFAPLATAGMLLLAVPFVFGSMRGVSIGQRITTGALIGIGFYLFNAVFGRLGIIYDLPPMLSAALPTVIVFGLWGWMMRRVR